MTKKTRPTKLGRSLGTPTYAPLPGTVPHPGETVLEWLERTDHSQVWLAAQLGMSPKQVSRIVCGHATYPAEVALQLGEVTGVPAQFWMHLQADYELNHALQRLLPVQSQQEESA